MADRSTTANTVTTTYCGMFAVPKATDDKGIVVLVDVIDIMNVWVFVKIYGTTNPAFRYSYVCCLCSWILV